MAEIILHPNHPDGDKFGNCLNEEYNKHDYEVNCVWHYCKYKRKKGEETV